MDGIPRGSQRRNHPTTSRSGTGPRDLPGQTFLASTGNSFHKFCQGSLHIRRWTGSRPRSCGRRPESSKFRSAMTFPRHSGRSLNTCSMHRWTSHAIWFSIPILPPPYSRKRWSSPGLYPISKSVLAMPNISARWRSCHPENRQNKSHNGR